MEHAARSHVSKKMDEDPVLYQEFSARIRQILSDFAENWQEQVRAFREWIKDLKNAEGETFPGLDPATHVPFFRSFIRAAGLQSNSLTADQVQHYGELTVDVVEHAIQEIRAANYWDQSGRPEQLRAWIANHVRSWLRHHPSEKDRLKKESIPKLADDLLSQIRKRSTTLIWTQGSP